MSTLKEQIAIMSEELQREFENNKVVAVQQILEEKCEEYLGQLQRSAEVLDITKEEHAKEVDDLESGTIGLQNAVANLQEALARLNEENKRLVEDNKELLEHTDPHKTIISTLLEVGASPLATNVADDSLLHIAVASDQREEAPMCKNTPTTSCKSKCTGPRTLHPLASGYHQWSH